MIFAVGAIPSATMSCDDARHLGPVTVNVPEPIDDPFRR